MQTKSAEQSKARFGNTLEDLLAQAYTSLVDEWRSQDLTALQAKLLDVLYQSGPESIGTLASTLGHSISSTTHVVNRLVHKSMVRKELAPNDRRVVLCELTNQGRATAQRLRGTTSATITRAIEQAGPEHMQAVVRDLKSLLRQAGEAHSADSGTGS